MSSASATVKARSVPGVLLVGASLIGLGFLSLVVADYLSWQATPSEPLAGGAILLHAYFGLAGLLLLVSSVALWRGFRSLRVLQVSLLSASLVFAAIVVHHLFRLAEYLITGSGALLPFLLSVLTLEAFVAGTSFFIWRRLKVIGGSCPGTREHEA